VERTTVCTSLGCGGGAKGSVGCGFMMNLKIRDADASLRRGGRVNGLVTGLVMLTRTVPSTSL
jgi:hypothetical protein